MSGRGQDSCSFLLLKRQKSDGEMMISMARGKPINKIRTIPQALKFRTKMRLIEKSPQETVQIIMEAVEQVDSGSTKRLDFLVNERISEDAN